jgi:hypothetical protein
MDTIRRGNAAEAAVLTAFVRADLHVYVPFGEGSPCDLLVERGDELFRVQVKCGRVRRGASSSTRAARTTGAGRLSYVGRADVFGVHVPALDQVFVVPVGDVARYRGYLRLAPTRNNQQRGVRYAADYAVEDWARSLARPRA